MERRREPDRADAGQETAVLTVDLPAEECGVAAPEAPQVITPFIEEERQPFVLATEAAVQAQQDQGAR